MLEMFKQNLKRHKYKIVVGLPMAVLLASSLSLVRDPAQVCIVPTDNRYVAVGEDVALEVTANATEVINVIGAKIRVPQDLLTVESISKEGSILTLWTEEPHVSQGIVQFSGGIVREGGFLGDGTVLTIHVRPTHSGNAEVSFDEVHMLAHDGTGREVECGKGPIMLSIRDADKPSPDVNHDKQVNIFDLGLVSANIFLGYESFYDLNSDGTISVADLSIIFKAMR